MPMILLAVLLGTVASRRMRLEHLQAVTTVWIVSKGSRIPKDDIAASGIYGLGHSWGSDTIFPVEIMNPERKFDFWLIGNRKDHEVDP